MNIHLLNNGTIGARSGIWSELIKISKRRYYDLFNFFIFNLFNVDN